MSDSQDAVDKPSLTADAAEALGLTGVSRRSFLAGAGALIVHFSMNGMRPAEAQVPVGQEPAEMPEKKARPGDGNSPGSPPWEELDSWIAITADGGVIAYTGKSEIGQGQWTVQTQLVAEELSVPFERVKLIACDTALCPDQGLTSGSQSSPTNFNNKNLGEAAASAREALLKLASDKLSVPADKLVIHDGVISAKGRPSRKIGYGQLVGEGGKLSIKVDPNAKRKPHSEWTILGKPVPRPDIPLIVTANMEYVQHFRLPGMLHGQVVRPTAIGAAFVSVDESSVNTMPGFVKVVVKKNFVGVVAEKPWQAMQIANKLKVVWGPGSGMPKHDDFYDRLRTQKPTKDTLLVDSKDVDEVMSKAATVVKGGYKYPNQAHASMGTCCAVADVQGDKATLYSATQAVWPMKHTAATVMGLKADDVHVIFKRGSGCYGINNADAVTYDAALLSQAVGKPVRVQLIRKDEMGWENYGFAFTTDERAGLDEKGNIVAWDYESWSAEKGGRPGAANPGNVITGALAGFKPAPFQPKPATDPKEYANLANDIPAYFAGNFGGKNYGGGSIESERCLAHTIPSPLFTGPLRSPGRLQNTFSHECFMDELAAKAKADPVEFRIRHLRDPRLIEVVKGAAETANWETRPSPNPKSLATGVATGRGIACVAYEGDNGWAALVSDVEVDQATGKVTVKHFYSSNDCGPISNPNGLLNQIEGGALHGMSRALGEEVLWNDDKVTTVDWSSYHTFALSYVMPEIKVKMIDRPDKKATGAGEFTLTVVCASIGNAIFDATGVRVRQAPFTPERVKAAIAESRGA